MKGTMQRMNTVYAAACQADASSFCAFIGVLAGIILGVVSVFSALILGLPLLHVSVLVSVVLLLVRLIFQMHPEATERCN
ncbi:MAG: hypothetical protein IJU18_07255 [Oscillospiraceae bacterium]|nr:hypothetical protein [Oscillospiraceae bacterium]